MFIKDLKEIEKKAMVVEGAKGAYKQVAIGPKEGWDGYVLRVMTLETAGNTPQHKHPWPHINYVLSGLGTVAIDGKEYPVKEGTCAYIPADSEHSFVNIGESELKFICIVPEIGEF